MKTSETIVDEVQNVLSTGLPDLISTLASLEPRINLPQIAGYYQEEFDYEQILSTPGIILFREDPIIQETSGNLYIFDLPLDIAVWDISSATGIAELHRRLDRYRRAIVTLLLEHYTVHPGYWEACTLDAFASSDAMAAEGYSEYGRALGVSFRFRTSEMY